MKHSRNEKMSEHLLNIDEEILAEAYEIDDAEKLKEYIKTKSAKAKQPFYMTSVFRKTAAAAACYVLIIGVLLLMPTLFNKANEVFGDDKNHPGEAVPPWQKGEEDYLTINSIDMLNYYSAIRVLENSYETKTMSAPGGAGLVPLSAGTQTISDTGIILLSDSKDRGAGDGSVSDKSEADAASSPKVIYYELERNAVFTVSKVIFFQIELTDADGFLTSEVGTGTVDVVITENDLEDMITFRNGDRYYSCCWNGGSRDIGKLEFTTHKYVENFCIVKNFDQDNYRFIIEFDGSGNAEKITCLPFKTGGPSADGDISVVGTTHIAGTNAKFTIAELEEYFNYGKTPGETEESKEGVNT